VNELNTAMAARAEDQRTSNRTGQVAHSSPTVRLRRDAARNHLLILDAAREVLGEHGAGACIEQIADRAGVGVGTVYRRFESKDALIDELLRLALEEVLDATERALSRTDGYGLEDLLRALGQSFADHRRYANLLLARTPDDASVLRIRTAIEDLTSRAVQAKTLNPEIIPGDVMALVWATRGLVQALGDSSPHAWKRFLDIALIGMRSEGPLSEHLRTHDSSQAH
jgi:AcrR family transcriptional regulator